MKTVIMLITLVMGLVVGGCVEYPMISDEEYYARRGPAPHSADPMNKIPSSSGQSYGASR